MPLSETIISDNGEQGNVIVELAGVANTRSNNVNLRVKYSTVVFCYALYVEKR